MKDDLLESATYVGRCLKELDSFLRIWPKLETFKYNRNITLVLCHTHRYSLYVVNLGGTIY